MRLKLLLAYDGTGFSGWQVQEKPAPPPTVQGTLEAALARLTGGQVRVFGSGRTDAGVHAHGQVAHCDVPERPGFDWRHALNAVLPPPVRVLAAEAAAPGFDARRDALSKTYVYQFWREPRFVPPTLAPFVWSSGPLDEAAMRAALPAFLGERDFASLRNAGSETRGSVRRIFAATLTALPPQEFYPPHVPLLRLSVTASGFLKQMVRNMAGLLAACGRGKISPDAVPGLLAARDRAAVPAATAPPQGLALARVDYGPATRGAGEALAARGSR
ncbi:tRNA pseudouridine(38-40) synthase TruA [Desulfovibrio sp.]|uniref:tRNA pseudouridine(38-40) synthase TruA n=1 Tax=Desulfovibrio sp. TaxID=885 RepID=UPI0023CCA99E|nr:tRNA pseudouridine(38-40) synthase TruA [Desulfovibrio sp.]MDE7241191.1 tRNA pseudouridine(38-40) synthase TruA [Desulfovibrio sp.]